ncbi:hypothetical protein BKA65DRAFT_578232 [Rhexocercosporidium sp. MPI-PUGE-AT-0058]|nr:hypothetical protein BKA65DRAFT_578232 [Rhexocercosporidium sp. MPI-PUGE-AT-0058]
MEPSTQNLINRLKIRQIFQFPTTTYIENIHVRPNGHLLFTTLSSGDLYTINPNDSNPIHSVVATLPGSTGLAGIATVDAAAGIFAVSGGEHISMGFAPGSVAVYIICIPADSNTGVVLDRISVDGTLNGMTSIPGTPDIVLSVDSVGGRVMRINTRTRAVDVAISDPSLGRGDSTFPIGVNGVKVRNEFLYFTNSALGTFARFPIDAEGNKKGDVEIMATLPDTPPGANIAYDDFDFDRDGNAYVACHSYSFLKITPGGEQSVWLGGKREVKVDGWGFYRDVFEPMAAKLGNDGNFMYLSTGGAVIGERVQGGQILEVEL